MKNHQSWLLPRLIVFVLLVIVMSSMFTQYSRDRYERGITLTKNQYIENYSSFKEELLSSKPYRQYGNSLLATFLPMLIIIGAYEGIILLLSIYLRKGKVQASRY